MNATSRLRPSAISPRSVQGPSAMTWPASTRSPSKTTGFWLMQEPALDRSNLSSRYVRRCRPADDRGGRCGRAGVGGRPRLGEPAQMVVAEALGVGGTAVRIIGDPGHVAAGIVGVVGVGQVQ